MLSHAGSLKTTTNLALKWPGVASGPTSYTSPEPLTASSNGAVFGICSREDNSPTSSPQLSSSARLLPSQWRLFLDRRASRVARQRDSDIETANRSDRAGADFLAGEWCCFTSGAQQRVIGKRPVITRDGSSKASTPEQVVE